jgi:hypothetical protein
MQQFTRKTVWLAPKHHNIIRKASKKMTVVKRVHVSESEMMRDAIEHANRTLWV